MTRARTLASWCAALATILSGIAVSNAQDIKGSIRHTSSVIVIDGNPDDAAWATANEYTLTGEAFNVEGSPPDDDDDLSATWKALWDEDNFYFYAVVTDDYNSDDGPDAWQDDSFELYLDTSALGKDADDPVTDYRVDEHPIYQLTVFPGEIEVKNGINHALWLTRNGDSGDMNAVANTTEPGGYSIEWAIPWSTLSDSTTAEILDRGFFGFGVAINDDDEADGERESQLAWATESNQQWNDPTMFPDVELLFPEGPGPDIFVKSAVDLGRVSAGAAVDFDLEVGNVGQENTLTISSISVTGPDQGLVTVGELASVAPGEVGTLAVTLDTAGRTGAFDFTIEIQSDDVDAEDQTRMTRVSASVINFTGPAAHFSMDDDAGGTELRDITGYNRHGTLENGATLGGDALAAGGSLSVSGGGQGVVPGEGLGPITDFTVSMWIQPSELAALQTVFGQGLGPTFAILVQNGDLSWFSDGAPEFSVPGAIVAGTTYHVAASYTETQAVLYLDGVAVATQDSPSEVSIDPLDSYFIGAFEGDLAFSGLIDDVQIYDRVISAEDVAELFATPGTVLGAGDVMNGPQPEPGAVVLGTDDASGYISGGADIAGDAGLTASYWLLDPKEIPTDGEPLHREGDGGDNSGYADGTYATDPAGTFTATGFRYEGNDLTPVTEWLADDGASFDGTDGIIGDGLFRFEGFLYAEEAGNQTIDFTSDDGSVLYVGNQLVINNDNGHGNEDVSGTVFFPEPGFYPIDVRYFNGDWTNDAGDEHGGANFIASGLDNTVQRIGPEPRPNILVNGSFEDPAVDNINANNLGVVPTGWSQTGDDATWNVIRNDGSAYDNGVDKAADGSQVLDLNGEFEIFQNFTLAADSDVTFGASFANRSGHAGDPSTVGIYDADGATLLSAEVTVDTSAEPQPSEVWASGEATVSLAAGEYRVIVDLNNWNNVDAVFVSPVESVEAWAVTSDLEGLDAGTVNGQGGWISSTPDTTLVVSDDGNQVLEVTTASQNAYRPLPSAIPSGTTGTVFFRARPGDLPDFVLGVSDVAEPGAWDDFEGYMRFAATNMDIRDGGGFATVLENFSVDTWYNIWLVIDNTALETTLYYSTGTDAAQLGGTGAFRMTDGNTEHGDITTFLVRTGNAHVTGQVDDIYVDVSGENLVIPQSVLDGGGGTGGDPLAPLVNVGFGADGAFGLTLPDGVTGDVEYSTDLIMWETIANGVSGAYSDPDAGRAGKPAGFYRAKQ